MILETETTTHTENKYEPEQTNKTDYVTKMEVKDLKQIEESFLVGQISVFLFKTFFFGKNYDYFLVWKL